MLGLLSSCITHLKGSHSVVHIASPTIHMLFIQQCLFEVHLALCKTGCYKIFNSHKKEPTFPEQYCVEDRYIFYFARETKFHTHYRRCTNRYLQDCHMVTWVRRYRVAVAVLLPYSSTQTTSVLFTFTVKWSRWPCIQFSLAHLQHHNSRKLCTN
jgi:hypothetical protein